ncbi:MAG: NYN domain-containing protein [Actinomycetota bacterium]
MGAERLDHLPPGTTAALVRGIGAYLRATPATELPPKLRRFRGFRPKGLGQHSAELLGALEDEGMRGRIREWLDDAPGGLSKDDARCLRDAVERGDGWFGRLAAGADKRIPPPDDPEGAARDDAAVGRAQERARVAEEKARRAQERARTADEKARRAREEAAAAVASARARSEELAATLDDARAEVERLRGELVTARADAARAAADLERERRKTRRRVGTLEEAGARAAAEARAARRHIRELERAVTALEGRVPADGSERSPEEPKRPERAGARARRGLKVPKGRLEDEPETLEAWLAAPRVALVVDGYNVAKAEGGYGDLDLADQRRRVVDGVAGVARRTGAPATIVFDGSEVPAGVMRRGRGPVDVHYSRPDEIADDHIVALLETLPPDPIVVVTNDGELRGRCARLGASVASSQQLLALFR